LPSHGFLPQAVKQEISMAVQNNGNRKGLILGGGAVLVVLLVGLFLFGGGHNNGEPSAPSGPGNAMQTDQGR
jgi:hypothetical protein